jgi:3,4-dihydroxy 2-butanone 4-phosphate synthase/GTP cyclohydrolase II
MVVVVDDPGRENEGDVVMAAEKVTPEAVNFMATHARGLICVPMTAQRLAKLSIPPMVTSGTDPFKTAFHVSVDHRALTTTGISATDRANTIRALADRGSGPSEFVQPGHVFPIAAREGGVLTRAGHTEAAVDLARLAGLAPAGVICEIAAEGGEMARLPALRAFATRHRLPLLAISDLIAHRRSAEPSIIRVSEACLPLEHATFGAIGYRDPASGVEHLAIVLGDVRNSHGLLVRVHSECVTGDVFGSRRCDCGAQLNLALQMIAAEREGIVIYLRGHEGRGIGLAAKLDAYDLQDQGLDTVDANLVLGHPVDSRGYGSATQILADLGVETVRLLTNNPAKRAALDGHGVTVIDCIPLIARATPENVRYLETKRRRMGHELEPHGTDTSGRAQL